MNLQTSSKALITALKTLNADKKTIESADSIVSCLVLLKSTSPSRSTFQKLCSVLRKPLSRLYAIASTASLEFSSIAFRLILSDKITSHDSSNYMRQGWEEVANSILSGILDSLDEIASVSFKEDVASAFYSALCQHFFHSPTADQIGATLRITAHMVLSETLGSCTTNQLRLRDSGTLGGERIGMTISRTKSFFLVDSLLTLVAWLLPPTLNTAAGRSRRARFVKSVFSSKSFKCSQELVAVFENIPSSAWEDTAIRIVDVLATVDTSFPQPFQVQTITACGRTFTQPGEADRLYVDPQAFVATVHEQEDVYESLDVSFLQICAIVVKTFLEDLSRTRVEVTLQLTSPPRVGGLTMKVAEGQSLSVMFTLAAEDLDRFTEALQGREMQAKVHFEDYNGSRIQSRLKTHHATSLAYGLKLPEGSSTPIPVASFEDKVNYVTQVYGGASRAVTAEPSRPISEASSEKAFPARRTRPSSNRPSRSVSPPSIPQPLHHNSLAVTNNKPIIAALFGGSDDDLSALSDEEPTAVPAAKVAVGPVALDSRFKSAREGRQRAKTTPTKPRVQTETSPLAVKASSPGRDRDLISQFELGSDNASNYQPPIPIHEKSKPGGDGHDKNISEKGPRARQPKADNVLKPEAVILSMQPDSGRQRKRRRGDIASKAEATQTSRLPPKKKKRQNQDSAAALGDHSPTSHVFKSSVVHPRTVKTYRRKGRTSSPIPVEPSEVDFDEIPVESEPAARQGTQNGKASQLASKAIPARERQTRSMAARKHDAKRQLHNESLVTMSLVGEAKFQPRSGGNGTHSILPGIDVDQPSILVSPSLTPKRGHATIKDIPAASGNPTDAKMRASTARSKEGLEDKGYAVPNIGAEIGKSFKGTGGVVFKKVVSTKSAEDHFGGSMPYEGDSLGEGNDQSFTPGKPAEGNHVEYSVSLKGSESSGSPIISPAHRSASHNDVVMIDLTQEDPPEVPQALNNDLRHQRADSLARTFWERNKGILDKGTVVQGRSEEHTVKVEVSKPASGVADRVVSSDNIIQPLDTGISTDDSRTAFDSATFVNSSQIPASLDTSGHTLKLRSTQPVPLDSSSRERDIAQEEISNSRRAHIVGDKRNGLDVGPKIPGQSRYIVDDKIRTTRTRPSNEAHSKHVVALKAPTILKPSENEAFLHETLKVSQGDNMQEISGVLEEIHQVILDGISSKFKNAKKDVIRGRQRIVEEAAGDIRNTALHSAHHFNSMIPLEKEYTIFQGRLSQAMEDANRTNRAFAKTLREDVERHDRRILSTMFAKTIVSRRLVA